MKIGLAGLGFMGLTHLRALGRIKGVELAAVADENPRRLAGRVSDVQGNLGEPAQAVSLEGVTPYREWEEMVEDPRLDAVDICLPTYLHSRAAAAALRAGKHVLVEKPMALDGASADAMCEAASRSGRVLMAAHVVRFFSAYRAAMDVARSGRLGAVRAASFRRRCAAPLWGAWLADKRLSGGGVFDLLIHDVDVSLGLFGLPEAVVSRGHEDLPRGVDWISAQLCYPDLTVSIEGGWCAGPSFPFSMAYTLVCDDGTVAYDSAAGPPVLYGAAGPELLGSGKEQDGYQAEIEYFLACCAGGKRPELCPPEESARAVRVTRLMADARGRGGERIPWRS